MENSQIVNLMWRGPYPLRGIESKLTSLSEEDAKGQGVYLHCLETEKEYDVVYIGKADSIIDRQGQHAYMLEHKRYSLVNVNSFRAGKGLDIMWIPDYGMGEPDNKLVQSNIDAFTVYFAKVKEVPPLIVEGALQVHFWRKMDTRRFLLTQKISGWSYRGKIRNEIPNDIKPIRGLDDIIDLQASPNLP